VEWLVITNNNWAKFQGLATIKGEETKAVSDLEKFIELSNDPKSGIFYFFEVDELRQWVQQILDELRQ